MDTSFFDQLQTPVILIDKGMKVIYYNHICPTFFKLPPRKLNKITSIDDLLITDYDLAATINSAFENESAQITSEIQINTPENNQTYTVIIKAIFMQEHVVLNLWDLSIEKQLFEKYKRQISELKETHNQILMSDKLTALGELTAGIGHEISNPLTIIGAQLEEVKIAIENEDIVAISESVENIENGFGRINKIIANLNSFLVDAQEDIQVGSLGKMVQDSIDFVIELDISAGIEIDFTNKSNSFFMGNELKLQQVLINLVKNAIDALRSNNTKESKVSISLTENYDTQNSVIRVLDNGPGISEEEGLKIFEMFYTTKELGEGTGLGLAISQKIVESHHGTLEYIPDQGGACFEIDLPFLEIESFSSTSRYVNGESSFEDQKILVISQSSAVLNLIFQTFKDSNIVLILSQHKDQVTDISDFYMTDVILDAENLGAGDFSGQYHDISKFCLGEDVDLNAIESIIKKYEAKS